MNDYPDFRDKGYQIISELGHNLTGGRVTYLGLHLSTEEKVVLKTFQFLGQSDWKATNYDAYQQETEALKQLSHPNIPRYLDSFETSDGFCLVQQYLDAVSLAVPRHWELQEIKEIAISVLNILAYLQSQNSPIIHRDIKPENILIQEISPHSSCKKGRGIKVYLVDFGFARIGSENLAASSIVKGTMGFMPPEQLFNRELTKASDLYGLGMTLICLLTGINSNDIGNYMDEGYRIQFQHLIPPIERGWLSWLEKMVNPMVKDRYHSAADALKALESIDVTQLPKVRLDQQELEVTAEMWGDICTVSINVINPIPDTLLSGWWEVASNPNDPPHTPHDHHWIGVKPRRFEGNTTNFIINIDTSQLFPQQSYQRKLILHTNSDPETYPINLTVNTGKFLGRYQIVRNYLIDGLARFILVIISLCGLLVVLLGLPIFGGLFNILGILIMFIIFYSLPFSPISKVYFDLYANVGVNKDQSKILALLMLTLTVSIGSYGWAITLATYFNYPFNSSFIGWATIPSISILIMLIDWGYHFFSHFFKLNNKCKKYQQNKQHLIKG